MNRMNARVQTRLEFESESPFEEMKTAHEISLNAIC